MQASKHHLANIFCLFLPMLPKKEKKEKKVLLPTGVLKSAAHTVLYLICTILEHPK
jgi:hypothetical protein